MNETESWRGRVGRLGQEEIAQFLKEPVVARLACLDPDGWPYVIPCWQEWDGDGWWVIPRERSVWARNLERDPRCAITVDESGGGQRKIVAQCTARLVERPNVGGKWVEIGERMAIRYLGRTVCAISSPQLTNRGGSFILNQESSLPGRGRTGRPGTSDGWTHGV
jgi:hypothetical protein